MFQYTTRQALTYLNEKNLTTSTFRKTAQRLGIKPIARDLDTNQNLWTETDLDTIKNHRQNSPGPGNRTHGENRRGRTRNQDKQQWPQPEQT